MRPTFRSATADDMRYVAHAWSVGTYRMESYTLERTGHPRKHIPLFSFFDSLFRPLQRLVFARAKVLVAANPVDAEQVVGFLIYEEASTPIVYYVHTKKPFHKKGIARAMLEHAGFSREKQALYASRTAIGWKITPERWEYVPLWLMPALYKGTS